MDIIVRCTRKEKKMKQYIFKVSFQISPRISLSFIYSFIYLFIHSFIYTSILEKQEKHFYKSYLKNNRLFATQKIKK